MASDADDIGAMVAAHAGFPFPVAPAIDHRRYARFLYWSGYGQTEIAELLGLPAGTIASWKSRDGWDKSTVIQRIEGAIELQMIRLVLKDRKTGGDFKEIDLLGRQIVSMARVRKFESDGGHTGHLNDKVANRNAGEKKKPKRNLITQAQLPLLKAAMREMLFDHQVDWLNSSSMRTRMILKARQIGATFYFAMEALIDAVETGRNQIFLSASKSQAYVFREYIQGFVGKTLGIELTGDPIVIDRGEGDDGEYLEPATLYFLGTNSRTAQSYHGNFYFDEFFWVYQFETLNKVARAMATQKHYRKTYLSTPSSINHEAYPFWTGEAWRKKRKDVREFDTGWKATRGGVLLPDRIWRQTVTVHDAVARGFDRVDIEELKDENSVDEFNNLYGCEFVDDSLSVFPMRMLQRVVVDEIDAWPDFRASHQMLRGGRPFGGGEVWLSYDPNGDGENADNAALVVVAPPSPDYPKFRVLQRLQLRGSSFATQNETIQAVAKLYNVTKVDIDLSGIGAAVYQLVKTWFPSVRGHRYDPIVKARMVMKTLNVIEKNRLEYPASFQDLTGALMTIRKTMTGGGRQMTYVASRTKNNGHADLAWALFQCLDNEPLEFGLANIRRSRVVIEDDD